MMGEPTFWDNQEKATKVIAQLKPLNAMLKPYQDLTAGIGDLEAMAELCAEDDSLEPELARDLEKVGAKLDSFELKSMLSGPADPNNAFLRLRAGGHGGQHQNKTQSAVRIIHKPTDMRAESRTERSQHKNYDNALKLLKSRLYAVEEAKRLAVVERAYDAKGDVAWGNQIRSYVLQPYTMAKDERMDVKTPQVFQVLDGDLDQFMETYLRLKIEKEHKKK